MICINVIYNLTQWIYLFIKWYLYGFILQFKLMNLFMLFIIMMIISIYLQWIHVIYINDDYFNLFTMNTCYYIKWYLYDFTMNLYILFIKWYLYCFTYDMNEFIYVISIYLQFKSMN